MPDAPLATSPQIFDRALTRARRRRAAALGPVTFLLDRVADEVADRLGAVTRRFDLAADLGTPGDAVAKALSRLPSIGTVIGSGFAANVQPMTIAADEEALPFRDASLDLVVSALALQFVDDLPGTFVQVRRALKPDGLFLAALIGGDSLTELRQAFAVAEAELEAGAAPHVAPFPDVRSIGMLLQRAGFALPVTDVDRVVVRYANVFGLMQDIRRMGAANVLVERRRAPTRRSTMLRMAEIYGERFADRDGRIRATFDIIWLSGWAPHESQQKPLRPGSAKASLEEAVRAAKKNE
jgi:SAM-dependent methyltransferase